VTQNRDIIKGIKGKTIAKKVGCGILVGAIAISNIVPFRLFTNTDIIVNAATSTVKTGVDRYASRTGTFVSKYLPNMDGGENFKLETVNYVQQIVAITDSKGNKYSADLINLQYKDSSAYSQYAARHYIPCLVNLKFVSSTNSSITEAVIPDSWSVVINGETKIVPILEIGDYAFSNSNLKTITIPSSVIQIADYGFSDARSLENVYFMDEDGTIKTNGENLVYVGNYAFSGCSNLKTAYLPKQLIEATMCSDTEEGGSENEFYASSNNYYTSDTTNYVGAGGKFGTNVYRDCISLENIEIDGKNIEIPANTFAGCKGIKNIQFSNNVKNALLRMSCFAGLDSLKDLTINCNVVLESYVFANEINLNSIAFNGEVKETEYRSSLSNSGALGLFSGSFTNVTDGTVMFNIPKTVNGDEVSLVLPESCFSGTNRFKKCGIF